MWPHCLLSLGTAAATSPHLPAASRCPGSNALALLSPVTTQVTGCSLAPLSPLPAASCPPCEGPSVAITAIRQKHGA